MLGSEDDHAPEHDREDQAAAAAHRRLHDPPRRRRRARAIPRRCHLRGTIMPMQLAPGVRTVGELDVLAHIEAGLPLIDTRLPKYLAQGTLPSARAIPHTQTAERLPEFDPQTDTILFCNGPQCAATPDAIRTLLDAGYPARAAALLPRRHPRLGHARASARAGDLSPRAVSTRLVVGRPALQKRSISAVSACARSYAAGCAAGRLDASRRPDCTSIQPIAMRAAPDIRKADVPTDGSAEIVAHVVDAEDLMVDHAFDHGERFPSRSGAHRSGFSTEARARPAATRASRGSFPQAQRSR